MHRRYSSAKTPYLGNCTITTESNMNFEFAGFMSLAVWFQFKTLLTLLGRHNSKINKTIITNKNNKLVVWWTWSPAWKWCDYQLWKKQQNTSWVSESNNPPYFTAVNVKQARNRSLWIRVGAIKRFKIVRVVVTISSIIWKEGDSNFASFNSSWATPFIYIRSGQSLQAANNSSSYAPHDVLCISKEVGVFSFQKTKWAGFIRFLFVAVDSQIVRPWRVYKMYMKENERRFYCFFKLTL